MGPIGHAVCCKHGLNMTLSLMRLRRARLLSVQGACDAQEVVRTNLGLHSTDYWSPYLSLFVRLAERFDPEALFADLNAGRDFVRVNSFRCTVHIVHRTDLPLVLRATGEQVHKAGRRSPPLRGHSDRAIAKGIDALCDALDGGPFTTAALKAALPSQAKSLRFWLVAAMGAGRVVRATAKHARSNRTTYALTEQWVAGFSPSPLSRTGARASLIRRYIEGFGPVCADDISWWLPATKTEVRRATADLGSDYVTVHADGRDWHAPSALADAPIADDGPGVWLLPYEDVLPKGYVERDWYLADGLREVLFPRHPLHYAPPNGAAPPPGPCRGPISAGEIRPSIWVGGRAVGRWEIDAEAAGILWRLHASVTPAERRAVEDAVEATERFIAKRLRPIS